MPDDANTRGDTASLTFDSNVDLYRIETDEEAVIAHAVRRSFARPGKIA
ncbi:hypothetical protein [Tritonibacter litoralis]|jgi:acetate kinase|nr:hypothetical protein [Tritonibacter litoralis]